MFLICAAHEETQRLLLMPNKAFYLPNISHHMEQILPEACLGDIQDIVRPYVQFIQGSDLPTNVPRCGLTWPACVNRARHKNPWPGSRGRPLSSLGGHSSVTHTLFWTHESPVCCKSFYLENSGTKGLFALRKAKNVLNNLWEVLFDYWVSCLILHMFS